MAMLLHIIRFLFKTISILIALGLILSYLSVYINPEKIWIPAFLGLFFLPLLILNTLLGMMWLVIQPKIAWINICSLLPSLFYIPLFIQFNNNKPEITEKYDTLKIMSYNVHLFGLLGSETETVTLPDIATFVKQENPDILCLQELSTFDTIKVNRSFRQYPYHHYNLSRRKSGAFFGIVTFSRYPIINAGNFAFPQTGNGCAYTDITVEEIPLRVYNSHLQSVNINLERTALRVRNEDLRNEAIRYVSQQLKTGFVKRAEQVNYITAHMAASPFPLIVCGDFNDTPVSYTYRKMKSNLNDCYTKAGRGIPSTYKGFWPAFRIDYIFSDQQFQVTHYKVPKVPYSDHYPVIVTLNHSSKNKL